MNEKPNSSVTPANIKVKRFNLDEMRLFKGSLRPAMYDPITNKLYVMGSKGQSNSTSRQATDAKRSADW